MPEKLGRCEIVREVAVSGHAQPGIDIQLRVSAAGTKEQVLGPNDSLVDQNLYFDAAVLCAPGSS